jgi:hypothetical protein
LPAPDGQFGLHFMLQTGGGDAPFLTRSLWGLIPDDRPDSSIGDVLAYTGGGYGAPDWNFARGDAGQPGIAFSTGVFDAARFFDSGNKMVLTDTIWNGTYVRLDGYAGP